MKKLLLIFLVCTMLLLVLPIAASAEDYNTEFPILSEPVMSIEDYDGTYPSLFNSGSPVWLHCEIEGLGEYVIVIDPNTNLQSFGFDAPTGYGLINNTGNTIVGRAYHVSSSAGYMARWLSFYKLQLNTGRSATGQTFYEDYNITKIYGTTLDLIDYVSDRGNDYYRGLPVEFRPEIIIHIATACVEVLLVVLLIQRRRSF